MFPLLLMSLMKNKLELVRLVFQKCRKLFLRQDKKKKKHVLFLKLCLQYIKTHETMFAIHYNTKNYTMNCI